MNADDLRNGEMSIAVTNIIDINHLKWIRWKVFSDAMSKALENTIKDTWIMMTAWETAVLWENPKFLETIQTLIELRKEELKKIRSKKLEKKKIENELESDIYKIYNEEKWIWLLLKETIETLDEEINNSLETIKLKRKEIFESIKKLEFNIGWTWLGLSPENDKLVEMKPGQKIVYFAEKPTKDWIIWPRSNWITRVRELIHNIAWKDWENLSFEEFLENIWEEKASKIPDELKEELKWLKMWNIATWKTTVFNPFISQKLLGWIEWKTNFDISSLIHITWNPLHKISSWIKDEDLMAEIDMTDVKIPQIIELLQHIWWISDNDAMSSWNMWTPYAIVCNSDDVQSIIEKAKENGLIAKDIWEIKEKKTEWPKLTIKWVWINNTSIEK
jgi:hypothetical protein